MVGRSFPHFRLIRRAFHALQRGRGQECVWEGGRVRALLCCCRSGRRYVEEAMESVGFWLEYIEPSEACDLFLCCARPRNTNGMLLRGDARLGRQHFFY